MITLALPWVLLALPVPLFLALLLRPARRESGPALRFPLDPSIVAAVATRGSARGGRLESLRLLLASLAWICLVLAAARPEWIGEPVRLPIAGRDLMMAIDVSGSMEQADFELQNRRVPRISVIKAVAARFIERRAQDRIGLVLFGSRAYLLTPLTFDRDTVASMLGEVVVGMGGRETAIGDAIALAVKHLRDSPEDNRVLVLLTDGASNSGHIEPLAAAELAVQAGVRIHTIGIGGSPTPTPWQTGVPTTRPSGDFDPETLQRIAEMSGGRYFSAHAREQLEAIYAELYRLEPSAREDRPLRPRRSLFVWPAAAALLLSLLIAAEVAVSAYLGGRQRVAG